MKIKIMCAVIFFCTLVFARDNTFVIPVKDSVKIYKNEIREIGERPLFSAGRKERLRVLSEKKRHYKVENSEGNTGWIEKKHVVLSSAKTFSFMETDVMGYLDNPAPVYIIMDYKGTETKPVKPERSFTRELVLNVDREEMERICGY